MIYFGQKNSVLEVLLWQESTIKEKFKKIADVKDLMDFEKKIENF